MGTFFTWSSDAEECVQLLYNCCTSFNPELCQDFGKTEHPLTAGAPPKTCFSCPAGAPLYRRLPCAPLPLQASLALSCNQRRLHYLVANFVRLPGNGSVGLLPTTSPKQPLGLWSHKTTSPAQQRTLRGPGACVAPTCMGRKRREGRGKMSGGVKS